MRVSSIAATVRAMMEANTPEGKEHHEALSKAGFSKGKSWEGNKRQEHAKMASSDDEVEAAKKVAHEHLVSKGYEKQPQIFGGLDSYKHPSGSTAKVMHDKKNGRVVVTTDR